MSAVFSPETLQRLKNRNTLTSKEKDSLKAQLFLEILANLGVLDINDVFEKEIIRPYSSLDKFTEFFLNYHKILFIMFNIPSTNLPPSSTHKWCIYIFRYICESLNFQLRKLGQGNFQLVQPVDEWIRNKGVEGGLWGMIK